MSDLYNEHQVSNVLARIGIEVGGETLHDFICFCPFHGNRNTPSFTVSKVKGYYFCQNAACSQSGTLEQLVEEMVGGTYFQVYRLIKKAGEGTEVDLDKRIEQLLADPNELPRFRQSTIDRMHSDFMQDQTAYDYMIGRGFERRTLERFEVGFSKKQGLISVPMHDFKGQPVGVIGRSVGSENKRFKNSDRLPTSKTLFNIHRAKAAGADTLIIVEASFDAMLVDQAGYPNVVATCGGNFNKYHASLVNKYFDSVVIMTDNDEVDYRDPCKPCENRGHSKCVGHNPGRALGRKIVEALPTKRCMWAVTAYKEVYPHGAKDPGEMTQKEIVDSIRNAVSHIEYTSWDLDPVA